MYGQALALDGILIPKDLTTGNPEQENISLEGKTLADAMIQAFETYGENYVTRVVK